MRRPLSFTALTSCALLALLWSAGPARAASTGGIQVIVTDPNGTLLAGATLIVTDPLAPSFRQDAKTDKKGRAVVMGLPPRSYDFRVEKEGHQIYESNFAAHAGEMTRKDVKLPALGAAGEIQPGGAEGEEKVVEKKVDPWAVAYNEAVPLYQGDKYEEAIARLDASLLSKPDYAPALTLKGIILEEHARCDEAAPILKQAWAADPNSSKGALGPLVRCLEKTGMKDEAASYRKILSEAGRSKADLYNEAVVKINEGDDDDAAPLLEQALQQDEKFALAQYQYGLVLFRRGDIAGAVARLETYLRLAPNGEFAADARDLLKALKP